MKKLVTLALLAFTLSLPTWGQQDYRFSEYSQTKTTEARKVYLGLASGINSYTGFIGPTLEVQLAQKFTVYGGVGLGSWGTKLSTGIKYYSSYPENWAFNLGISHATGIENIEIEVPQEYVNEPLPANGKLPFELQSANTLNFSAMKYWMIGKSERNRFNIELGYAMPFTEGRHSVKDGYTLNGTGKAFMNILQPGGFILGLGFSFAM